MSLKWTHYSMLMTGEGDHWMITSHTPRHTLLAKWYAIMTGVFVSWLWIEEIFCCQHHTTVVTWPQSAFLRRSLLTAGYCFCTREVENAQSSTLNGVKNVSWPLRIHWSQTINFHFHVNILTCFREMAWLTEAFGLCSAIRDVTWWVVQYVGPIFCTVVQATKVQVYSSFRYTPPIIFLLFSVSSVGLCKIVRIRKPHHKALP